MKRPAKKPHYHVTAGLIWKQGKVLIARRPKGSHLEGYWEFPGGKQEPDESLRSCLEREIQEELGIEVRAGRVILSVDHEYGTKKITLHFFNCIRLEGEPKALQGQEIRWVDPNGLEGFTFPPPDKRIIDYLSKRGSRIEEEYVMFYRQNESDYMEPVEGIKLKTLVYGEKTSLCEFRLEKGKSFPSHSHPHEQAGYVVSGRLKMVVGDEEFLAGPGDGWCIPGHALHAAEVLEDSVLVEVFSPVREDYLPG